MRIIRSLRGTGLSKEIDQIIWNLLEERYGTSPNIFSVSVLFGNNLFLRYV